MTEDRLTSEILPQIYHALSASRRCHAIQILAEQDTETLSVRALARKITAIEEDVNADCATGEPYRNVYNALSQTHLGTLSDASIIVYDSDRQTIAAGPNLDVAALVLALNQVTYQTLQGEVIPELENIDEMSITD